MTAPRKNYWRLQVNTSHGHDNKSHRGMVRMEDRPRTRKQAIAECGYLSIVSMTQRCIGENRFGRRCGRYTTTDDALCLQHRPKEPDA